MDSILNVITPAESYDLTSLANVKAELAISGATDDGLLGRYISACSKDAQQYCDRPFVVERLEETFPPADRSRYLCGKIAPLQLSRWPIVEVVSVVEGDEALTANDYLSNAEVGQLVRVGSDGRPRAWRHVSVVVTYRAGFEQIPSNLEDAVIRMVTKRYRAKGRDASVKSEDIPGVRSVTYWIATGNEAGNVTRDVADILDNFKVPILG